ncbi:MAG: hypothetical protein KAS32_30135 [Candidatus Peribacteraceae bacterium]|nr:hypothetical protein [Candidatus Peribacteraceae bacterium]
MEEPTTINLGLIVAIFMGIALMYWLISSFKSLWKSISTADGIYPHVNKCEDCGIPVPPERRRCYDCGAIAFNKIYNESREE